MTDLELAEEIERRRGGTDMLNSVLMRHQWDQIIAALRRGPEPVPRLCPGSSQPAEFFGSPLGIGTCGICKRTVNISASGLTNTHPYEPERPPSGEMVMVPREPTKNMIIAGEQAMRPFVGDTKIIYRAMIAAAEAEGRKG